jgi:hypothetical protein
MKRPKIVNASLLTLLSLVMAGSLLGCQSKPSTVSSDSASASVAVSDTASASASVSESASPSPSVDQTPTVTVSEDPTIVWGTEDPDLTQFFTLKVGDSAKTVTSDMLSGSVNTAIEGTYPVTLTTALNGTALTATAQVQVISKVVIDTPYSENPCVDGSNFGSGIDSDQMVSCFAVYIDDRQVAVQPSWISGEVGTEKNKAYPITLKVSVNGRDYSKNVNLWYVEYGLSLYTSYKQTTPYTLEEKTATVTSFDFASLFGIGVATGMKRLLLVDQDKASGISDDRAILGTIDKSKINFDAVGIYPVSCSVSTVTGEVLTVTSYVSVTTNIHITDSGVKSIYALGDIPEAFDLKSLFAVTEAGQAVDASAFSITDQGGYDRTKAGEYVITAQYKDISYQRTIHNMDATFFGTYDLYDFTDKYWLEYTINTDGTVALNWQNKGYTKVETTGTITLTTAGKAKISTANDNWTYNITLAFSDGLMYRDPDTYAGTTTAYLYSYMRLFYKKDAVTITAYYKDTNLSSKRVGLDVMVIHDEVNDKDDYVGFYYATRSGITYLDGVYRDLEVKSFDTVTTLKGEIVVPEVGDFTLIFTKSGTTVTMKHDVFTSYLPTGDPTGLSGIALTDTSGNTITMTYSQSSSGVDTYKFSGSKTFTQSTPAAYLIANSDTEATFAVIDGKKNTNNTVFEVTMDYVKINKTDKTFTLETVPADDKDGQYLSGGDLGGYYVFKGNYCFVNINMKLSTGYFASVADNGDGTYTLSAMGNSYCPFTKTVVRFTAENNAVSVVSSDYKRSVNDIAYLYNDVKNVFVKGSTTTLALSATAPEVSSLFTITYKDTDGTIKTADPADIVYSQSVIDTTQAGIYCITASYTKGEKTYCGQAVVTVTAAPFADSAILGTYTGYWTYGPNGSATITITADGYYDMVVNKTSEYSDYLYESSTKGVYIFNQAGYQGTLWFDTSIGAIYGRVAKGEDTVSFLSGMKKTADTDTVTITATTGLTFVTGLTNQAILACRSDTTSKNPDVYSLLTYDYSGAVDYDGELVKGTLKTSSDTYTLTETYLENETSTFVFRHYVGTKSYQNVLYGWCEAGDSMIGDYKLSDTEKVSLDGFGVMTDTVGETVTTYDYVLGSNNVALCVNQADSKDVKYIQRVNKKTASLVGPGAVEADKMANQTFVARVHYYSGTTLAYFAVNVRFDGYGFATLTSDVLRGTVYLRYSLNADGTVTLASTGLRNSQTILTKLADGNYVTGKMDDFQVTSTLTFDARTTFSALAED